MENITQLLNLSRNELAEEELYRSIYHELKKLARSQLNKFGHRSLDTTELVHEAYMKLSSKNEWNDRSHFFAVSAIAMRHILVNIANKESAQKRNIHVDELKLFMGQTSLSELHHNIIGIDRALNQLELISSRACRILEFRIFVGLTVEEIAELLDISVATVKRDWALAKTWLYEHLNEHYDHQ